MSRFSRCRDWYSLWHEDGGWHRALDPRCYTPAEFRRELAGLGYVASERERGEQVLVRVGWRRAVRVNEPRPA